jgi:predicted DNA-binding protein YlxM (UPF0122 family)
MKQIKVFDIYLTADLFSLFEIGNENDIQHCVDMCQTPESHEYQI